MKRIEVLNLPQVFESLKNAKGLGFAYALMKNKKIIEAEKENLKNTLPTSEDYQKFLTEMNALIKDYCVEQTGDSPILLESVELLEGKDKIEFENEVKKLQTSYAEAISERKANIDEYQSFIKDDSDVEFYRINESYLPDESTMHELIMLSELINFEEREKETIEITKYSLLTYTNIFNRMVNISSLSPANCEARNKCLYNFVIFRNEHRVLYNDQIIKDWLVYEKERKNLASKFAATDIFGDVLIKHSKDTQDDQFIIKDDTGFNTELGLLNEKYEKELTAFYNFLNQKINLDICKIKQDELPESMNLNDLQTLELFIKN
jgi:hypothetical protein